MNDPFSPEADPGPVDAPTSPAVTRRELLVLAPAAALLTNCATPRFACGPRPEEPRSCQHRFCRYYRQPG
ncbi:MAG: hypothetical protein IAE78_15905 [Myxococcus sp.]|nr:hypothetical protein [Myxococcus sp.]